MDVMLSPPIPFEQLWADAAPVRIAGHEVRLASVAHLIEMKSVSGRPQDVADIDRLRALQELGD